MTTGAATFEADHHKGPLEPHLNTKPRLNTFKVHPRVHRESRAYKGNVTTGLSQGCRLIEELRCSRQPLRLLGVLTWTRDVDSLLFLQTAVQATVVS